MIDGDEGKHTLPPAYQLAFMVAQGLQKGEPAWLAAIPPAGDSQGEGRRAADRDKTRAASDCTEDAGGRRQGAANAGLRPPACIAIS